MGGKIVGHEGSGGAVARVRRNGALAGGQGKHAASPHTGRGRLGCRKTSGRIPCRHALPSSPLRSCCCSPRPRQPSQAQDLPDRPIRMVVAFPAGGPTDFVGRLVADKLKDILGQTVIIENKPGANGAIGADYRGEVGAGRLHAVSHHRRRGRRSRRTCAPTCPTIRSSDFAPVTLVVRNTTVLVVRAESPAQDDEGIRRDRQSQARRADRSPRPASARPPHLALELFQSVGRRQVRARALSRRGACADRSARRPGPVCSPPTCRC